MRASLPSVKGAVSSLTRFRLCSRLTLAQPDRVKIRAQLRARRLRKKKRTGIMVGPRHADAHGVKVGRRTLKHLLLRLLGSKHANHQYSGPAHWLRART